MRYQQLILEKAALDRKIRAFRVVRIRAAFVERKGASVLHKEMEKMEELVSSVFYDEKELDFLLDHLEVLLDLDVADL